MIASDDVAGVLPYEYSVIAVSALLDKSSENDSAAIVVFLSARSVIFEKYFKSHSDFTIAVFNAYNHTRNIPDVYTRISSRLFHIFFTIPRTK